MKIGLPVIFWLLGSAAMCQTTVVLNTPGADPPSSSVTAADAALVSRSVLPKVRKLLASDACEEAFEAAGAADGSFTRVGARQRVVFYQFCQTGNGFGAVGLAIIEAGKLVASFAADAGWAVGVKAIPDINENGLDEIALYYSGGIHQGAGGTGVDILELGGGKIKGLGWFQAESFDDTNPAVGYLVTAKQGNSPAFFREKKVQTAAGKWRTAGRRIPLKVEKVVGIYSAVR